jgi:N-acetylmuramoyl-L-alanine amidase
MNFFSRLGWALARWRRGMRVSLYAADMEAWVFVCVIGAIIAAFGVGFWVVFAHQDERREFVRQYHEKNLACLARNVYYEARGEPTAGQYAVAEVTMNRKASGRFPNTVCEVVHQKNWDPIRRRHVGAFAWTEFSVMAEPGGEEWERAQRIAEDVYYRPEVMALKGALYFHATYIRPSWAKEKKPVATIGNHVFYR